MPLFLGGKKSFGGTEQTNPEQRIEGREREPRTGERRMFATKFMDHAAYSRKVKKMTESELLYTIKDCKEVLAAWNDHPNNGYYSDEICYCSTELHRRKVKATYS